MNEQNIQNHLIEYLLTLLNFPQNNDLNHLIERKTAYEIIKFMDEMPGGFLIYHADNDEQIIYANNALLRIFQCNTLEEFRELTGNSFKGLVYHEDLNEVEQSIKEQISNSQYDLDYVEYRIVRKDGAIRWIEDYGHFIHSEAAGDIFYVFLGDATEKRARMLTEKTALLNEKIQKEQKIQNLMEEYDKERKLINQEYLRRLDVIEGLSVNYDSIFFADLDEDIILPYQLSSRTKQQFGENFQVRSFTGFFSDYAATWVYPEDLESVSKTTAPEYICEKLSNNKTYYINFRVLDNNEIQYLQLRIVNVGTKDHISQIVIGCRRVDEEIRREMEQKQMLENALHNAKLAIVAKNTFLSNMSHDMRTPLNAILGYTALARKYCKDSKAVLSYLDKLESSGRQLLGLIDKTLEISWAETKDIHIEEHECNLCDIIQEVYSSLIPQITEKNLTFSLNSTALEHCNIYSDHDKLKQLLLYLANNAITYTKNGGRIDLIVTEPEMLPNDYAVYQFIVKDTGIGISQDFLEHIFEPFEREKNTTFSGIYGTGLGLTIAKNIAETMGGTIDVDSTVGKGSVFTVTLRFRIQKHPLSSFSDAEDSITYPSNQKILLVEDNDINLEIETEILLSLGFLVDTATDGSIAVEKVAHSNPGDYSLILMDIQMPVMNGRQAAAAIRKFENPLLSRIPIIALSADAYESDKQLSLECGMDAHLTKPIDVPLLLETITKTLKKRKS